MKPTLSLALFGAILFTLSACGGKPTPSATTGKPSLATFKVTQTDMPWQQNWDGTVEAVHSTVLTAQTNARVLDLPHDVGDNVPAGAVLVRFTDVEQKSAARAARAQIAAARATYVNAQAEFQRIDRIFAKGLVARAQLDSARAQRDAALAALKAAQANARSASQTAAYTVVRAPYAGVITQRYVHVGEAVTGPPFAQKLIGFAALKDLRVDVNVPQSMASAIRKYGKASVLTVAGDTTIGATRVTVFPYADPATHTFRVRVWLPSGVTGLRPGEVARVAFVTGSRPRLLIPESALYRHGELLGVYVVHGDTVSLRLVRLGHRFGNRVEVIAGLDAGERVVQNPLQAIAWLSGRKARAEHAAGQGG